MRTHIFLFNVIKYSYNQLPFPTRFSRACKVLREEARSLAQIFLPSTTPANRYFSEGKPLLIKSRFFDPRTRSNPSAVTHFKEVTVLKASAGTSAKYVSMRTFNPESDDSNSE